MTDRRLTLLIAAVVVLIVGGLIFRATILDKEVELAPVTIVKEQAGEQRRTRVWAKLTECNRSGSKTEAKGYIENTGNVKLNYVTVKVIWSNRAGLVVEENEMYALSNQALAPGETKNFTDVTENTSAAKCNVKPVDWW